MFGWHCKLGGRGRRGVWPKSLLVPREEAGFCGAAAAPREAAVLRELEGAGLKNVHVHKALISVKLFTFMKNHLLYLLITYGLCVSIS